MSHVCINNVMQGMYSRFTHTILIYSKQLCLPYISPCFQYFSKIILWAIKLEFLGDHGKLYKKCLFKMELFNGVSEVMRYWFTDIAVFICVLREVMEKVAMVKLNILPRTLLTVLIRSCGQCSWKFEHLTRSKHWDITHTFRI